MTVLDFARPYTAYDEEPEEQSMLRFIDHTTGRRLAMDYGSIPIVCFKPGDVVVIFHRFYLVILEGQCLTGSSMPESAWGTDEKALLEDGLYGLLTAHRISTIRTFRADLFAPPTPGQAVVERFIISDGPPGRTDWERWVYTQTKASA